MSNGRSNSSQTHAHWGVTIYEFKFEFILNYYAFTTPARNLFISGLKSRVYQNYLKMMVKSSLDFLF